MYVEAAAVSALLWAVAFVAPVAMHPISGTPIKLSLNPTGIIEHGPVFEGVDTTPKSVQQPNSNNNNNNNPPQIPQGGLQAELENLEAAKKAQATPPAITPSPPSPPSPPVAQPSQAVESVQPSQQLQLQQPALPTYGGNGTDTNNNNNTASNQKPTATSGNPFTYE